VADTFLWYLNAQTDDGLEACKSYQLQFGSQPTGAIDLPNFLVSKYFIPLVVFSQHATQLMYPSNAFKGQRGTVIAAHAIPCAIMSFAFGCSTLVQARFPCGDKTLFWGGDFSDWPFALIQAGAIMHSSLVMFGFPYFCGMEGRVLWAHVIPLACVVSWLLVTEGRMDFGSKWCSYCLIYSVVYVAEPLWYPDGAAPPLKSKLK